MLEYEKIYRLQRNSNIKKRITMAILETSNGEKYQVNKNVLFTKDGILVDGVDISLLDKVTKKCKCVDNCKRTK
jgi:hypothetical protein